MATLPLTELGLGEKPWLIGHRGAPGPAIENTVGSLRAAIAVGASAVELDLQLTADGEVVVVHDWDLQRLAGSAYIVEQVTAAEIAAIPLLASPEIGPEDRRIPTLELVLSSLSVDFPLNLELKRHQADPERFVEALHPQISGRGQLWVSSFDWDLLDLLHRRNPAIPLAPLASRRRRGFEAAADRTDAVALHVSRRALSSALLRRSRAAGRPVLVYTVNDAAEAAQLLEDGVAGLFTDEPAELRQQLESAVADS